MENYSSGSKLIRNLVILGDFVLLNLMILAFLQFFPDVVPKSMREMPQYDIFFANIAMAISEFFFHTILYERRTSFDQIAIRALKLATCQAILFFILSRFYSVSSSCSGCLASTC